MNEVLRTAGSGCARLGLIFLSSASRLSRTIQRHDTQRGNAFEIRVAMGRLAVGQRGGDGERDTARKNNFPRELLYAGFMTFRNGEASGHTSHRRSAGLRIAGNKASVQVERNK
jgi:hypothetical protein